MIRSIQFGVLLVAALGVTLPVLAVEPGKDFIQIWRTDEDAGIDRFVSLDADPSTPGIEVFALTHNCSLSDPDVNGLIQTTVKTRIRVTPAGSAASTIFTAVPTITSYKFPDFRQDQFQCGGAKETLYDDGDFGPGQESCARDGTDPFPSGQSFSIDDGDGFSGLCGLFPADFLFGIGIANTSSGRVVVFGDGVAGNYSIPADAVSNVEASRFAVSVYNATTGALLMTKPFAGDLPNGGELDLTLSCVGDYLNDDGIDELRVAWTRDTTTGGIFQYTYYDLISGAPIGNTVQVGVTAP